MTSMRRLLALSASLLLAVSLAACGDDDDDDTSASGDETTTTSAAPDEEETGGGDEPMTVAATVQVAETDLGELLVNEDGMTLYLFTQDPDGASACNDGCATTWPPLVADGDPTAGNGADESLLGTIARDDGTTQVTYNGHPLYTYANDAAPGDTTGHEVGDVWYALGADGEALESN
jgi:predicted lipoprotein with Yx(FWY)xxD motif